MEHKCTCKTPKFVTMIARPFHVTNKKTRKTPEPSTEPLAPTSYIDLSKDYEGSEPVFQNSIMKSDTFLPIDLDPQRGVADPPR